MLKRTIQFTDYDDVKKESVHYFNLSKPELVELEVEYDAGFEGMINKIIETKDRKALVAIFKNIVLMALGVQVQDGEVIRFVKNDEIREKFTQTMAYNELYMELSTDADKAAEFMQAILPEDVVKAQIAGQGTQRVNPDKPAPGDRPGQ